MMIVSSRCRRIYRFKRKKPSGRFRPGLFYPQAGVLVVPGERGVAKSVARGQTSMRAPPVAEASLPFES
jgi:hypothetical protein